MRRFPRSSLSVVVGAEAEEDRRREEETVEEEIQRAADEAVRSAEQKAKAGGAEWDAVKKRGPAGGGRDEALSIGKKRAKELETYLAPTKK